jgi:ABC-2 type transport system ATP-binding protein
MFGERVAVAGIDIEVPVGSVFGLLGPNGAGKTTFIRMLVGLIRPSGGEAWVLGHSVRRERAAALARVGAVVEEPGFHRHLTGRENLRVAAAVRGTGAGARMDAALARVGLQNRAGHRVAGYSLGMRQRLGIARCLLSDPVLLILDEPMNGLDPAGVREMRVLLRDLAEEGRTVLISSHLLDEVEKTCDRIAVMDRGRVIRADTVGELIAEQEHVLRVEVDNPAVALAALDGLEAVVGQVRVSGDVMHVRLGEGDPKLLTALVAQRLRDCGVAVTGLGMERTSLEERFLELTRRLEDSQ